MTSLAAFGSWARGDIDAFSDRDLLVVSDDAWERDRVAVRAFRRGMDVSCYTWSGLQAAAQRGDLFVDHLARESAILHDPGDRLRETLTSFRQRSSYGRVQQDGQDLFSLLEMVPSGSAGFGWAYDVLFVAFRTVAIPRLACEGVSTYASDDVARRFARICDLGSKLVKTIRRARRAKKLYRSGCGDLSLDWRRLRADIQLVGHAIGADIAPAIVGVECAQQFNLPALFSYVDARRVERDLLIAYRELGEAARAGHAAVVDIVLDPRGAYSRERAGQLVSAADGASPRS